MCYDRDAEIIYGKILSKNNRKRKRTKGNMTGSEASTYLSDETSMRDINRNKVQNQGGKHNLIVRLIC